MIAISAFFLVGCQSTSIEPSREFFNTFSIGDIVAQNETFLLPGSRVLNGMEAGPVEPFIQKYEEINFQIDSANLAPFLDAVKTDIQEAITNGDTVVQGYGQGGGSDSDYFSFEYTYDQVFGIIHIWAVRGPENNLNIIVLLTETSD